ncbi:MAG: triphosphoribosyl-dephospho-CoA synthase [Gammaproteobacteria bacterium]|jgi:triphosphoribosyl-dephospho-CoA synthase
MNAVSGAAVREAYLEACAVELQAFKPGNVSIFSAGHGMTVSDFRSSAQASADALASREAGLGLRIYRAIADTHQTVGCNTNLGIVLLCAPLMQAMLADAGNDLRRNLGRVLDQAGESDTQWVYRAIRLASPAGLGAAARHDVYAEPHCSLVEAMWPAARRDRIAFQYVSLFKDIFEYSVPRMRALRLRGYDESWAAVGVFLGLLKRAPDTHVARKYGKALAREVSAKAARLEGAMCRSDAPEQFLPHLEELDAQFKHAGINPGTTADLTVATLLAVRLEELMGGQATVGSAPSRGTVSRRYQFT